MPRRKATTNNDQSSTSEANNTNIKKKRKVNNNSDDQLPTFATAHKPNAVSHLVVLSDGSLLSAGEKEIKHWSSVDSNGGGGNFIRSFKEGVNSPFRLVMPMPDGLFFTSSFNGLFLVWEIATGRQLYRQQETRLDSAILLKHPKLQDFPWLCGTNNGVADRYRFRRKRENEDEEDKTRNPFLYNLLKKEYAEKALHDWRWDREPFRADGTISTSTHNASLCCLVELTSDDGDCYDGAFASGSWDYVVKVNNILTKKLIHVFRGHTSFVKSLLRVPNQSLLVSSSDDGTMRFWSLDNVVGSGQCVRVIQVEPLVKDRVKMLLLKDYSSSSSNNETVVTLSPSSKRLRFWDTTSWTCDEERTLTAPDVIRSIVDLKNRSYQAGVTLLLAGLADGSIQVYMTASKPNNLVTLCCRVIAKNFTQPQIEALKDTVPEELLASITAYTSLTKPSSLSSSSSSSSS
eukprot:TRINITY_DN8785_c0_g1_i1.p1 TRINITY_DN8785_c0_g1~~TRINITY_DN8785_c0_g1_i1.p1  ORF type:complete len:460 (+),score=111.20 TRINITY_DN8785_c0_g1_i1:153-1532(+)